MLIQEEWEKFNDLVIMINSIEDSNLMRTAFLQKLMTLIDFDFSEFDIGIVRKNSVHQLVAPIIVSKFSKAFEEEFIYQYENIYAPMDYVNWVFMSPESLVYRESDLLNDEVRKQSPFYIKYLKVHDLTHISGIVLASHGVFYGAVTLYRRSGNADFSDRDLYILKQIMPHLNLRIEKDSEQNKKNEKSLSYLLKNQYKLTNREIEIMGCLYDGLSNIEIAGKNGISINTAKKHAYNIFGKLEIENRAQLFKFIINNNLSDLWKDD